MLQNEFAFGSLLCQEELNGPIARVGRGEMHTGFWWGHERNETSWKQLDVYGRIIQIWILKKYKGGRGGGGGGDWIDLAQDGDKWSSAVKAWMNLRVL